MMSVVDSIGKDENLFDVSIDELISGSVLRLGTVLDFSDVP